MIPPLVSYPSIEAFLATLEESMRRSRKKNSFFVGTSFDQVREDINVLWKAGLPPIVSRRRSQFFSALALDSSLE